MVANALVGCGSGFIYLVPVVRLWSCNLFWLVVGLLMLYLGLVLVCWVQFGFSSRYETNYKRVLTYDVCVRSEVVIQCGCENVKTNLLPITHSIFLMHKSVRQSVPSNGSTLYHHIRSFNHADSFQSPGENTRLRCTEFTKFPCRMSPMVPVPHFVIDRGDRMCEGGVGWGSP